MIKSVILFLTGFAGAWLAVLHGAGWAGVMRCEMRPDKQPKDSTIAYRRLWDDLDYSTFYHELDGGIRKRLSNADVLIVGSSRVQFGLDKKLFKEHFKARDQKVYNLGFAWAQTSAWSRLLLDQYRIGASWIIMNADPFFDRSFRYPVNETMATTRLRAGHQLLEAKASILAREKLADWRVPRMRLFNIFGDNDSALYRDQVSGWWDLSTFKEYRNPTNPALVRDFAETDAWQSVDWQAAREYAAYVKSRKINTVLINIPHHRSEASARVVTRKIAEEVGLPFLEVDESGIETYDGSHLSEQSAKLYSTRLLVELDKLMARTPPPSE